MAVYAVIAVLWIMLSEVLLAGVVRGVGHYTHAQILKGWPFVAATSALLYALIRRDISTLRGARAETCSTSA